MAPRIPVEERQLALVLALLASEYGLTKDEILSTVQGYRQRYTHDRAANASLERQFERDKDDIRELGVPLEALESPDDPGNNQATRYRIPRARYELPDDVTFTPEETALLKLAAMVWRGSSVGAESRRAMMKLASLGVTTAELELQYAPRIRVRDAAFEPLRSALDRGRVVRFQYLKPGDEAPTERQLSPLALTQYRGLWHLYAAEADGTRKTFLLSRIVSPITVTAREAAPHRGDEGVEQRARLDELWQQQVAVISVTPGTDAASRLSRRDDTETLDDDTGARPGGGLHLRVHYTDTAVFADELAAFGPEAGVLEPESLRTAVVERLTATVTLHSGTGGAR